MFDDFWIGNCCDFEQVEEAKPCSMVPANLNSLSRHFLCAKGFHQFTTVFSRLGCQNEKIDLETKQISRCIYNIF